MTHRPLGRTGVNVSPLCLGTMMFGAWGNTDHDECIRIIHKALDQGINFVDTADVYAEGETEEIVGKALKGRREHVVLATKVHGGMGKDINQRGNSRRWIVTEVEASLKRLQTDWIDLYQLHRHDPNTDFDETLRAMDDLITQGKIRYAGTSTFPAAQIVEAQWSAREHRLARFVTEQPPYSILTRHIEADVLPTCLHHNIGVLSWSPLARGWLSGKWRKNATNIESHRAARMPQRFDLADAKNQKCLDAADALAQLAEQTGLSLVQMSIAFVLRHPAITSAIIGPRTMEQLDTQVGADTVVLDTATLDKIDAIVTPGTTLVPTDVGWQNPALKPQARRR